MTLREELKKEIANSKRSKSESMKNTENRAEQHKKSAEKFLVSLCKAYAKNGIKDVSIPLIVLDDGEWLKKEDAQEFAKKNGLKFMLPLPDDCDATIIIE